MESVVIKTELVVTKTESVHTENELVTKTESMMTKNELNVTKIAKYLTELFCCISFNPFLAGGIAPQGKYETRQLKQLFSSKNSSL